MPTAADVSALAGRTFTTEQATAALSVVTTMARSYCRASWPDDELPTDVSAVVQTATLRLLTHPGQLPMTQTMAAFTVTFTKGFEGFTSGERITLDRYRRKAL